MYFAKALRRFRPCWSIFPFTTVTHCARYGKKRKPAVMLHTGTISEANEKQQPLCLTRVFDSCGTVRLSSTRAGVDEPSNGGSGLNCGYLFRIPNAVSLKKDTSGFT